MLTRDLVAAIDGLIQRYNLYETAGWLRQPLQQMKGGVDGQIHKQFRKWMYTIQQQSSIKPSRTEKWILGRYNLGWLIDDDPVESMLMQFLQQPDWKALRESAIGEKLYQFVYSVDTLVNTKDLIKATLLAEESKLNIDDMLVMRIADGQGGQGVGTERLELILREINAIAYHATDNRNLVRIKVIESGSPLFTIFDFGGLKWIADVVRLALAVTWTRKFNVHSQTVAGVMQTANALEEIQNKLQQGKLSPEHAEAFAAVLMASTSRLVDEGVYVETGTGHTLEVLDQLSAEAQAAGVFGAKVTLSIAGGIEPVDDTTNGTNDSGTEPTDDTTSGTEDNTNPTDEPDAGTT